MWKYLIFSCYCDEHSDIGIHWNVKILLYFGWLRNYIFFIFWQRIMGTITYAPYFCWLVYRQRVPGVFGKLSGCFWYVCCLFDKWRHFTIQHVKQLSPRHFCLSSGPHVSKNKISEPRNLEITSLRRTPQFEEFPQDIHFEPTQTNLCS